MRLIRIIIGIFFLFSGISKLFSMESFELYIYSFGLAGFDLVSVFARAVIVFELVLGLCYLTGLYRKATNYTAIISLIIFSAFLLWRFLAGDTRSCHCMGDLVDLNPFDSLVKNVILLIFMVWLAAGYHKNPSGASTALCTCGCGCGGKTPAQNTAPETVGFKAWYSKIMACCRNINARTANFISGHSLLLLSLGLLVSAVTVFAVAPPDAFFRARHQSHDFVQEEFDAHASAWGLDKGRRMVCFFSTSCEFCQKCAGKVAGMLSSKNIPMDKVHAVFMQTVMDEAPLVEQFFQQYGQGTELPYSVLHPYDFIALTQGSMPVIVLLEDGVLVKEYDYISLSDKEIEEFFKG